MGDLVRVAEAGKDGPPGLLFIRRDAALALQRGLEVVGQLVADVAAEAVWRLQLPSRSQRNMPLDYQLRAQSGELMRPSESLQDERVRDLLTAGQVTVIPRLTAA